MDQADDILPELHFSLMQGIASGFGKVFKWHSEELVEGQPVDEILRRRACRSQPENPLPEKFAYVRSDVYGTVAVDLSELA